MKEEINLKSIEVDVNIGADVENLSRMLLVFNEESPTEIFNGITQAVKDVEIALRRVGILTEQGIGTGEMNDYINYMMEVVPENEQKIYELYKMLNEIMNSELIYKYAMVDMIQDRIDGLQEVVDNFNDMFEDIKIVPPTPEQVEQYHNQLTLKETKTFTSFYEHKGNGDYQ